jgi:hypothetical protein
MHTARRISSFCALTLALLVAAGSGPVAASVRAAGAPTGPNPAVATIAIDVVLTEIGDDGTLLLTPEEPGAEPIELRIPEGVKIRAQRKKEFDGRRKLEFADLQVGQRLRLTVLPSEQRLVDVTVLKTAAT